MRLPDDSISKRFTGSVLVSSDSADDVMRKVTDSISAYKYDQYQRYPALHKSAWIDYLVIRFKQLLNDDEWFFLYNHDDNIPHLLGCRISAWDYDLFGVRMASISIMACGDSDRTEKVLSEMLDGCLAVLRDNGVAFVSSRINGDNIAALHAFESCGFRYYENIIWPVASCEDISADRSSDVRLMTASDFDQVIDIASTNTFQRSHYHCDEGFNKRQADQVLAKQIESAWAKDEPIAIIESEGRVTGFFAFKIDQQLSDALGYRYGRMKNLALEGRNQSKGLGTALFSGAMSLMKEMGAEYIDSGYSSKNHVSAKLHARHAMYSVCEEATFHLWL